MTALALAMQDAGWHVSGSDTKDVFITDEVLSKRNIPLSLLGDPIPACDLLIHSAAYPAPKTTIPTLNLAQALADFVKDRRVIAVAGVGGKTTTSAMLAALFHAAGRDVGYYVGTSTIAGLAGPGHAGTDPYYVIEADEYAVSKTDKRPKFALLNPEILITTNIVHDHPDIYPREEDTVHVFSELVSRIPQTGTWVYNDADPLTLTLLRTLNPVCKLAPYNLNHEPLKLSVFGDQNQLDARAAVLAATATGLSLDTAKQSILAYQGAGRRQESHGEVAGRLLYDDYGHHPGEIEITTAAFKANFPGRRVLLVFESHTYTRTESLLSDFAKALSVADQTFIMPIFESAREKGQPHQITPESFAALIPGAIPLTWENAAQTVWQASRPGDIILTMGAGFVYKLHEDFKKFVI
jgi:UDP-N-acetylmuramate--alanine ligase